MKIRIPIVTEVEINYIQIDCPVDDEDMPKDFPFRKNDTWRAFINVDTGVIEDWPAGRIENLHITVRDSGKYTLLGPHHRSVAQIKEYYVPHGFIPGQYGDTIELQIDGTGRITNWPKDPEFSDFFKTEND